MLIVGLPERVLLLHLVMIGCGLPMTFITYHLYWRFCLYVICRFTLNSFLNLVSTAAAINCSLFLILRRGRRRALGKLNLLVYCHRTFSGGSTPCGALFEERGGWCGLRLGGHRHLIVLFDFFIIIIVIIISE